MARNTEQQRRDEKSDESGRQNAAGSADQARSPSETTRSGGATSQQTDRERSIQTDRERGGSAGVTRRQTSPISGSSYGSTASPFSVMRRMADDMDRLFENFGFGRSGLGLSPLLGGGLDRDLWPQDSMLRQTAWAPQVEMFRRGDQLIVRADLPGLNKEDVRVEIEDGILAISGERREEQEENRENYYRTERSYGQFYRAVPLPEGVNPEQCDASFKDGVLEVILAAPKESERKARRVQIR